MIHLFTWGLLITAIVLSLWLDKRVDANRHQFLGRHIVLVVVVIGWLCFMGGGGTSSRTWKWFERIVQVTTLTPEKPSTWRRILRKTSRSCAPNTKFRSTTLLR